MNRERVKLTVSERKKVESILAWLFKKVRSPEELEAYLIELGYSKNYAKWRVNT